MTEDEAVRALEALTRDDQEAAHSEADAILCAVLRSQGHTRVAEAFEAASHRVEFWYA